MESRLLKKCLNCVYFFLWFAVIFVLLSILCVYHYFPDASFNQIFFHILYLDWHQLSFWWKPVIEIIILSIFMACVIYKFPPVMLISLALFWGIYSHPIKVSNIKVDKQISLSKQLLLSLKWSNLYEEYYHKPQVKKITNKKNVILIFAESMEDNFADEKYWGENLIPHLSKLKNEGISFSGYKSINGTNWTLASNIATFCGIPLRMHLRDAVGTKTKHFLPNIKCLPDILKSIGYYNVFSTSTYLSFVGTDVFVDEHSFDELYGRDELIIENYASQDDIGIEKFGINDKKMFEFARKKIISLTKNKSPFFITIQTVDTHFPHGYVHPTCSRKYGDTRDAIKCSDLIIYNFIRWIQKQDFYNDTIIVITGDHLMMNFSDIASLIEAYPDRQIYNVILEKGFPPQIIKKDFSMMDLAATIAAKIGVLSGDYLGLGISLLSDNQTLVEKLGIQKFEEEILQNSSIYNDFLGIKSNARHKFSSATIEELPLLQSKMIAHAGGSIDGNIYTNSLDALNASLSRGYKYIEFDLLPLFDRKPGFFAAHDYEKFKAFVKDVPKFDRDTIKTLKILDKYSPLTDEMILDFFEKHPDMWLVIDKVYNFELLYDRFQNIKDRMIVEVKNNTQFEEAKKYGFKHLAYTLRKAKDIPLVLANNYESVVVSLQFLRKHKKTLQNMRLKRGIKVMVYTLKDKEDVWEYGNFVDMIYYDGEDNIDK